MVCGASGGGSGVGKQQEVQVGSEGQPSSSSSCANIHSSKMVGRLTL